MGALETLVKSIAFVVSSGFAGDRTGEGHFRKKNADSQPKIRKNIHGQLGER